MCITEYNEAEILQMTREEGRTEGNIITLYDLYCDGALPLQKAAAKAKMSETNFLKAAKKLKKA